jgi:hypothetical protein
MSIFDVDHDPEPPKRLLQQLVVKSSKPYVKPRLQIK